jgi:hypothetical protein
MLKSESETKTSSERAFMLIGVRIFFICLFFLPIVSRETSKALCAEGQGFVSQTYVDTLIQSAYTALSGAQELSRSSLKQEDAVERAKHIAERLKKLAQTDKNRKYILWKIQELESQIYLEEKGLLQEKDQKRRMAINDLIGPFNAELSKTRPDFAKLDGACAGMKELDPSKERELRFSERDRSKGVSKDIVAAIERYLEKRNFDAAREDLAYCKNNQQFLSVSLTEYSRLAAKVQASVSAADEKAFIIAILSKAEAACLRHELGAARAMTRTVDARLDAVRGTLNQREWDKLYFSNKNMTKELLRKEDSLVAQNMLLLKTQGVGVATVFSDSVLKKWDVASEKISMVNYAILEEAVAQKRQEGSAANKTVAASADNQQEQASLMDDILAAAKIKAKAKEDSLKAEEQNAHLTHAERVRLDNMRLAQQGKDLREQKRVKENKEKAQHLLVDFYTLLDQGKRKNAENLFKDKRGFFKEYLAEDSYLKLESTISGLDAQATN